MLITPEYKINPPPPPPTFFPHCFSVFPTFSIFIYDRPTSQLLSIFMIEGQISPKQNHCRHRCTWLTFHYSKGLRWFYDILTWDHKKTLETVTFIEKSLTIALQKKTAIRCATVLVTIWFLTSFVRSLHSYRQ